MPREILIHLNVEAPDADGRSAEQIAEDIKDAVEAAQERMATTHSWERLRDLKVVVALAEEV